MTLRRMKSKKVAMHHKFVECSSIGHIWIDQNDIERYSHLWYDEVQLIRELSMGKLHKTSIGGQAIYEGVMMRGPKKYSVAIRLPDGTIKTEVHFNKSIKDRYKLFKLPILRGISGLFESLALGYKTLLYSFEKAGLEEGEPSKFDLWLEKVFGKATTKVIVVIGAVLGVVLALGLFSYLPSLGVKLASGIIPKWARSIVEGLIKIAVFVIYLAAASKMPDIERTFEYHGAEHKTIFTYEEGAELTVEEVRKRKRFHPRCGTSFILIVLVISIIVSSLPIITWENALIRAITKLAFLPLIVGISYEIIHVAGKYDNIVTRTISAPGMWLQRITTREPNDEEIEVAIAAMIPVLTGNPEDDKW